MADERLVKLADGLYVRHYDSGKAVIMLQFPYYGVRNREYLRYLDPHNPRDIKKAKDRIGAIFDALTRNTFVYEDFFPDSKRVEFFRGKLHRRTVKEIGDAWLLDMEKSKPHSTYRAYAYPMTHVIYPAIGNKMIRDVTAEDIREIFRNLDIGLKTASNYALPLRAIFRRAMADQDIEKNVFERVNFRDLISDEKQHSDYELDPLSEKEIEAFLKACANSRPEWLNYWTLAFYTGLRTSELFGLQWPDITGDTLHVSRAQVYGKDKRTKTKGSSRTVDLVPIVRDALKAQRQVTGLNSRVFWNPNTKGDISYKVAQAAFDYICGKAEIRRRPAYQTRHTFASNMLSLGENALYIAAQMGHKDTTTLFKKYARFVSAEKYKRVSGFGGPQIAPSVPREK